MLKDKIYQVHISLECKGMCVGGALFSIVRVEINIQNSTFLLSL